MSDLPAITCAICGKPVDHIYLSHNDFTWQIEFIVQCHGHIDWCAVDDWFLSSGPLVTGIAFAAAPGPSAVQAQP